LEPQLHHRFSSESSSSYIHLGSYTQLIDLSLQEIFEWDIPSQSEFISGHPRIGENSNLSKLSAAEQGALRLKPTPPEVLARLAHLNALYEARYPGLRYITFVNGRSRPVIAEEMEDVLGIEHSLELDQPTVGTIKPIDQESEEWRRELKRAVGDVGKIAKSRLGALGVA
jgi:2-oxo-4-hydroxy-4-carboxy--5-ureidoimidazoline (OHCU) decarboxylase